MVAIRHAAAYRTEISMPDLFALITGAKISCIDMWHTSAT